MFDNRNPYTLRSEVVEGITRYYVSFVDGAKIRRDVEVSLPVYEEFLLFVSIERKLRRWDERHREYLELSDGSIHKRVRYPVKTVEETVFDNIRDENIILAVEELTEIQRRRFLLHHIFEHTYEKIAEKEGCRAQAVHQCVLRAEEKIKEKCKLFVNEG